MPRRHTFENIKGRRTFRNHLRPEGPLLSNGRFSTPLTADEFWDSSMETWALLYSNAAATPSCHRIEINVNRLIAGRDKLETAGPTEAGAACPQVLKAVEVASLHSRQKDK